MIPDVGTRTTKARNYKKLHEDSIIEVDSMDLTGPQKQQVKQMLRDAYSQGNAEGRGFGRQYILNWVLRTSPNTQQIHEKMEFTTRTSGVDPEQITLE